MQQDFPLPKCTNYVYDNIYLTGNNTLQQTGESMYFHTRL